MCGKDIREKVVAPAVAKAARAGYVVGNMDCTIVCERPKIGPVKAKMQARLAEAFTLAWMVVELVVALWAGIADGARFYFAHSYHPVPADPGLTVGTVEYPAPFTCAIARANIFATQFHPEKSQSAGLQLLANFVVWDAQS